MRQSDNSEEFFKKYGFTKTSSMPHPDFKDIMSFEGLEADYVSRLEREIDQLQKFILHQQEKMDWLRDREFYKFTDKIKKDNK
jgi:hypothetical protein